MLKPILLAAAALASHALADGPQCEWRTLTTLPGQASAAARISDTLWLYAILGGIPTLQAFDLADPANPRLLSSTPTQTLIGSPVHRVAWDDRFLYAFTAANLIVIDPSDPAHPVRRGSVAAAPPSPTVGSWAAEDGALAYATTARLPIVLDVRNPDAPALAYTGPALRGTVSPQAATAANVAYFQNGPVLHIVDARALPAAASDFSGGVYTFREVNIHRGVLYTSTTGLSESLLAFDLTDPIHPAETSLANPFLAREIPVAAWDEGPRGVLSARSTRLTLLRASDDHRLYPAEGLGDTLASVRNPLQFQNAFAAIFGNSLVILDPEPDFAPSPVRLTGFPGNIVRTRSGRPVTLTVDFDASPAPDIYTWQLPSGFIITTHHHHPAP